MRAGLLRHRVTIQTATRVSDGQGGKVATYGTLASGVPASILPMNSSPRESVQAQQMTEGLSTKVTIRYRTGVSVKDRIVHGSRTLQIGSIQDPDGRRARLELLCSEVIA